MLTYAIVLPLDGGGFLSHSSCCQERLRVHSRSGRACTIECSKCGQTAQVDDRELKPALFVAGALFNVEL